MKYLTLRSASPNDFRHDLDRVFDDFWTLPGLGSLSASAAQWAPPADIDEEEDHFLLTLDLPGMKREDLQIEVLDSQVVISGERKIDGKKNPGLYSERRQGKFSRTFSIPSHVDTTKIEAQYQDGVLKVMVPKAESAKPRQIKIQ